MRIYNSTISVTTDWLEIAPTFDILYWQLDCGVLSIEVQEYLEGGWGTSIFSSETTLFRFTSCKKIRVKATSSGSILCLLKGFVAFRISGSEVGVGDMLKSVYDTDDDGIVDKAESIDDGAGNSASAADIKDAVDKRHSLTYDADYSCYIVGP